MGLKRILAVDFVVVCSLVKVMVNIFRLKVSLWLNLTPERLQQTPVVSE